MQMNEVMGGTRDMGWEFILGLAYMYHALQSNLIQTNFIQAIKFDDSATSKTN